MSSTRRFLGCAAVLFFAWPVAGQPDEEIHQTVARISFLSGNVSYTRGDQPDDWQNAALNVPMTLGDRVYTGDDGRLELQLSGGDFIRLSDRTDLSALNLTDAVKQFSLQGGTASFHVRDLVQGETFEIDTPSVAVTVQQPGNYRVDVDQNGNTRLAVRRGEAVAAAGGGQITVSAGSEMRIEGTDSPSYDVVALSRADSWDLWVQSRQRRLRQTQSVQYVSSDVVGYEDLNQYGRWENVPNYGNVWTPATVEAGWQPYTLGHWMWQDPWGWTWVGSEPWGWAPYHYGRWISWSSRWYWVPVAPAVRFVAYSPALVAFVGGGPGWSAGVVVGGGAYVGWFPLAPRDPFYPWWGPRVSVQVTNVTYVNRTYVTVVNQNTFVGGGTVWRNTVRDPAVVRQIEARPVLRGPVPVVPTAASLRVSSVAGLPAPVRPSPVVATRPVVTRLTPPPLPPAFSSKAAVIRENKGAPVAASAAAKLATARPATSIRPVASETGAIKLAPRNPSTTLVKPQPVTTPPAGQPEVLRRTASPPPPAKQYTPPPAKTGQTLPPPPVKKQYTPPEPKTVEAPPPPPPKRQYTPPPAKTGQTPPPPPVKKQYTPPEPKTVEAPPPPPPKRQYTPPPAKTVETPPPPAVKHSPPPPPAKEHKPEKKPPEKKPPPEKNPDKS